MKLTIYLVHVRRYRYRGGLCLHKAGSLIESKDKRRNSDHKCDDNGENVRISRMTPHRLRVYLAQPWEDSGETTRREKYPC